MPAEAMRGGWWAVVMASSDNDTASATCWESTASPTSPFTGAVSSAATGRSPSNRMVIGTGPAPPSNTMAGSARRRSGSPSSPRLASATAVPMLGWPAKGSSWAGVKMRTLRVSAGSSGGSTKVVSE